MQVLKDKHVVSYFKDLHSKYVIVPADKAGNQPQPAILMVLMRHNMIHLMK